MMMASSKLEEYNQNYKVKRHLNSVRYTQLGLALAKTLVKENELKKDELRKQLNQLIEDIRKEIENSLKNVSLSPTKDVLDTISTHKDILNGFPRKDLPVSHYQDTIQSIINRISPHDKEKVVRESILSLKKSLRMLKEFELNNNNCDCQKTALDTSEYPFKIEPKPQQSCQNPQQSQGQGQNQKGQGQGQGQQQDQSQGQGQDQQQG